ncbi:putative Gdp-mannose 46 dehydratase [Leptomonas pyrrhocoris]|uniref:Putative Gdp-mannose 46 dehydratase n=1 Tax=Leptomonas pyrrhocoris TaxID=157538 RepID=A0A0M9FQQ2_LEPPY|nr:putative Gdp-mannose 46 dehydratase [Leptomonas pyrrhocoris]KPA74140.1 putative Gdp-mannose 46 dehydratase [Leptomonas pyrrhocoris]|eukprot:XP_015652579.1 putative Gdp-mannose 46 dehydratase [Leptomonas pyrrhocoris]
MSSTVDGSRPARPKDAEASPSTTCTSSSLYSADTQHSTRELLQHLPGRRVLVTGGCGFIGSCFIRCLLQWGPSDLHVYNVDTLEYCAGAHVSFLTSADNASSPIGEMNAEHHHETGVNARYHFTKGSILDAELLLSIFRTHSIDIVVNMAAQTHVDKSFTDSLRFTQANVVGTHTLLECAREYGRLTRLLHISTDEVYGETVDGNGPATEADTVLRPTNPYAATKAAAEHLAFAYFHSFHLPVLVSRGNNVYGPGQYPEKVIPKFITECLRGARMPIQGDGHHQRSFLYVDDVARGLVTILTRGELGAAYNVASTREWSVCEVARHVVACVTGSAAEARRDDFDDVYVRYVADRAYNDARYCISNDRLTALGWVPLVSFGEGLRRTVEWYRTHPLDGGYWEGNHL